MTKELEDYLTSMEKDALPDFKPLEPEIGFKWNRWNRRSVILMEVMITP